ncbi:DER1-like protein [Plasmodium ovale]|uniref:Derlin n=1 Tax=Plasmodium ovale TaxID=36330 RepID=A0A1C3KRR4_PLAOA|nr:DER1-like protein [Plasmodium ovale]
MLMRTFFLLVCLIVSARQRCSAVCLNKFTRDFVKGVTFNAIKNGDVKPNSMVTQWKRAKQQYSLYTREKKEILKKKGKKKFSLNYSNSSKKKKKKKFFFLNFSKYNEVKESIKALFNLDYVENNYIYSYVKSFKRTPPITKLYLISTFLLSVLIHINKNVYKLILYDFHKIFKKGEIWRLITPYLYIGNLYLQYILMFNYLNIYMSSVEIAHYKNPEDFLIFLTYGYMLNILFTIVGSMYNENVMEIKKHIHNIGNLIMKKCKNKEQKIDIKKEHYNHLGYVFSTYILYYWSRINEGTLINCFELFLIKAEYVPFFFVIQNILLYNEFSFYEVASILASYLFFTYEGYLKFHFLRRFFRGFLKLLRMHPMYDMYREEYE